MSKIKIVVIGLGYVGLPLARLFSTKYRVTGFDINTGRIAELKSGTDSTLELEDDVLQSVLKDMPNIETGLFCTNDQDLKDCNYFVVTVPTPVDSTN